MIRSVARRFKHATDVVRRPLYAAPGHYLSPISTPAEAQRAERWKSIAIEGIDLRLDAQVELVESLLLEPPVGPRWQPNEMFGSIDAAYLRAMIRERQVRRVVEVGSGWSTAAMLDADADIKITCVEPYPGRLFTALGADRDRVDLLTQNVQDLPLAFFAGLGEGDLLFIDSTHVAKAGSDVVYLVFHVLPRLSPGVLVHVHDVHWPFEYPARWLSEHRDWNEAYLLRAFLMYNADWRIDLMTSWIASERRQLLPESLRGSGTGSLWMTRI